MKRFQILLCIVMMGCFGLVGDAAVNIECNRECLAGFITNYLQALLAHDASTLPVTKNVKYTENGVRLNLTDGLWNTASAMPTYRLDVVDEESGMVGLLGKIDENGNQNWFAARLKVEKGKQVSEIETLIVRNIMGGTPDNGIPKGINTAPHPAAFFIHHRRDIQNNGWQNPSD